MLHPEVVGADYRDCSLLLIAYAIPELAFLRTVSRRFATVPLAMAKRNGIGVAFCSMGGPFSSNRSPVMFKSLRGQYAGRSCVFLPAGPVCEPLAPGQRGQLVYEIPLGPAVAEPDQSVQVPAGIPLRMRLYDRVFLGKAEQIYQDNLARWL